MLLNQWPYEAAAIAFEAIPRTLAQNCGVNVIRTMTALQGKVYLRLPFFFHIWRFSDTQSFSHGLNFGCFCISTQMVRMLGLELMGILVQ